MVATRNARIRNQKGGKVGTLKKFKISMGAVPYYGKKGAKVAGIGTGFAIASPIPAGVSIAKTGIVAAGTAAISAPTRAIQGSVKTPWQLAKLGVQKIKERRARSKLAAAGLHNYENLKQRVTKRKLLINTLQEQKKKLNENKLTQNLAGRSKGLSGWWKNKQIARKDKAIEQATTRFRQSLERKGERTQTAIASETSNISEKAKKFIEGLNTSKQRQMNAYDAALAKKKTDKTKPIDDKISELGDAHPERTSHATAKQKQETASAELTKSQDLLKKLTSLKPTSFVNGKVTVDRIEYTRDDAITKAKELRGTIKTQTAELDAATREFNKSAKAVAVLDAEVAKLKKQQDEYMAQGKTAEQLYGSFKRRQARVQQTKKDLGKSVQQLTGISTIKNIGRATYASFQQDLGLAQKAIKYTTGKQLGQQLNTSLGTLAKSVGKSLTSSQKNLSSRYSAIKEGVSPLALKIKTLWRGYVSKFSKQGKLLKKMNDDANPQGELAKEANDIIEEYQKLKPNDLIPPALRERHQALINKRQIMKTFADLIAKNRSTTPNPKDKIYDKSSWVGQGAKALKITLPITNMGKLQEHIQKAEKALFEAKDYPSQMKYKGIYNHLKSIKRWDDSKDFNTKADKLVEKLNTLLPGLEVLPEFKPQSQTSEA
jgi:hypothetical protein